MPEDDPGERLARLEEQMKQVQADIASAKRMIFGGVAILVAFLWNKIAAVIGLGPNQ